MDRRTALFSLTGMFMSCSAMAAPAVSRLSPSVTIDRLDGKGRGRRPTVVLLHGSDGITRRAQYQVASAALAAQGFTVLFPHYFETTDDRRAFFGEIQTKYPLWMNGLRRVIDEIATDRAIDTSRLAIVGVSLGGALALSLAANDRRIKAVVSYFGFAPSDLEAGRRSAPTLLLHGSADRIVPVANADQIEARLLASGVRVEKQIYPDEGHGFSQPAQLDAATRTAAFLRRHLGG